MIYINPRSQSQSVCLHEPRRSDAWEDKFTQRNSLKETYMKPLSEQLTNLSVRAKNTVDAAAAAQKETHDKVVASVA